MPFQTTRLYNRNMNIDINALVDADRGLIGRSIFIDPRIYEQESRAVFARCWM